MARYSFTHVDDAIFGTMTHPEPDFPSAPSMPHENQFELGSVNFAHVGVILISKMQNVFGKSRMVNPP
jgi:hypothetical protein